MKRSRPQERRFIYAEWVVALGRIKRMGEGRRYERGRKTIQSFHSESTDTVWRPETPMIGFSNILDRKVQFQLAHTGSLNMILEKEPRTQNIRMLASFFGKKQSKVGFEVEIGTQNSLIG